MRIALLSLMALCLLGCADNGLKESRQHDYQIIINGSAIPEPVQYSASYACLENGLEIVRDISGAGSNAHAFRCQKLLRVRLQRTLSSGLVSLSVYSDGEVIYETPPTESASPLLYVAPG